MTPKDAIQARGALLFVRSSDETVVAASENAAGLLGAKTLIGETFQSVTSSVISHDVRNARGRPLIDKRRTYVGSYTIGITAMSIFVLRSGDGTIVELEPTDTEDVPASYEILNDVALVIERIRSARSSTDALDQCASLLQIVGGYDCVAFRHADGTLEAEAGTAFECGINFLSGQRPAFCLRRR